MIEIDGPDGVIYEFPAGTDDATIKTAMGKVYGAPQAAATEPATPERGFWHSLGDNVLGYDDGVQSYGEQLGTWLNRAGESATLGLIGDEASAGLYGLLPGRDYDSELERFRANEAGMSTMGRLSADLTGALMPAFAGAGAIGQGGNLLSKIGIGAALGGSGGGLFGFMEGEGGFEERRSDAVHQGIIGALLGSAIPAIGAGVGKVAKGRAARSAVRDAAKGAPSTDELRAIGSRLYQQVDDAGVQIKPAAFDRFRTATRDHLRSFTGFDELPGPGSLTPNTARVMDIMDQAGEIMAQEPSASLPFRSLDQMRRQAGSAAGNMMSKGDQQAGTAVIQQFDDFVRGLGPDDVVGGDVPALQSAIEKAREVWGRMSRSQVIDDAIEQSENYLGGGASGVRNQLARILRSPKLSRGFSEAEKIALRGALRGGVVEQAIGLAGGGIGRIAQIATGAATGGVGGAVAGLAGGQAARSMSEVLAMRAIEQARAAVASGALRKPGVVDALLTSGVRPERLTNAGLLSALLSGQQATP